MIVSGEARVFENAFNYLIKDYSGTILAEGQAMANAYDVGQFGGFELSIPYLWSTDAGGFLEVFNYSAKDGSIENLVVVPVIFPPAETMELKLYFNNDKFDPTMLDCSKVYPITRIVKKTITPAKEGLMLLLAGVSEEESEEGYFSNIPKGVNLKSLKIEGQKAYVDFDENLQKSIGGSCRVSAIRAQIEETLKQFDSINEVQISIEGKSSEILQP